MKHLYIVPLILLLACAKADESEEFTTVEFTFNFWTTEKVVDVQPEQYELLLEFITLEELEEITMDSESNEHDIQIIIQRKELTK